MCNLVRSAALFTVTLAAAPLLAGCQTQAPSKVAEFVESNPGIRSEGAAKVLSGDAIEVGGRRVRLFGIKAPDVGSTILSDYSISVLHGLIDGKRVYCIERWKDDKDVMVADCTIQSPTGAGTGLNALLLRSGAAYLNVSDLARSSKGTFSSYQADQFAAQHRCIGVWKAALIPPFTDPASYDISTPGC